MKNKIPILDEATHTYTVDGVVKPSVTQILSGVGLADYSAPWFTEERRQFGEVGHKCIYLLNDNDLDWETVDPALVGPLKGYLKCKEEIGFRVILNEQALYSELYGFCGKIDAFVQFLGDGTYGVLDWKFGTVGLTRSHFTGPSGKILTYTVSSPAKYQLALYRQLIVENWDETKLYPWQVKRGVMENIGSGEPRMVWYEDGKDHDIALAAVTVFNARR